MLLEYYGCNMPRRRASNIIVDVLASAEKLRDDISALPSEIQGKIKDLALAMVTQPVRRRGRPPKKIRGRPRKRGKPPKPKEVPAQT
jgi:hypothetical protein